MSFAFVFIIALLLAALVVAYLLSQLENRGDDEVWDAYLSGESSQAQRILSRAARPLANVPALQDQVKATRTYRSLEAKLRGGGAFAGSLEIYLSIQVLAALVSSAILISVLVLGLTGFWLFIAVAFALMLVVQPYNQVHSKAKERARAVTDSLPDFAELLAMVLPNSSILTGLAFTAERTDGPVAEEVTAMVGAISSRTLPEADAFRLASDRLGTPEAQAFITTLMNAYIEGTKALDAVTAQAEAMRKVAFQNRRAEAKKLPTKLILIFGMHFMPALFIVAFLPLALGFGSALG